LQAGRAAAEVAGHAAKAGGSDVGAKVFYADGKKRVPVT
jgi:hypothetical protein